MKQLYTAIPTPFLNNKIDFGSLEKLINFQIENKVDGLVLSGSTGEGHNLSYEEWQDLLKFVVKNYKNKIDIVAGVGFNSTVNAVKYSKKAEEIGVDYILATVPYYNKPQQNGIYHHFKSICQSVKTDVIIYNVPSRTATDISNDTISKLFNDFSNIVGLKDATGKLERVADLKSKIDNVKEKNNINRYFVMLSGEDATQIGFNAMGGVGVISVVSNIAPKLCKEIQENCKKGNFVKALKMQNILYTLSQAMFCETNPVPVKYALYKMNIFATEELRLPLVNICDENKKKIDEIILKYITVSDYFKH